MAQCYLQPSRTSVVDVDHSERGSVVTLALGGGHEGNSKRLCRHYIYLAFEFAAESKNSGRCGCFRPPSALVAAKGR
jgi:hypothetical protein